MDGGKLEALQTIRSDESAALGRWLFRLASAALIVAAALQILNAAAVVDVGFADWRPLLYAFLFWSVALGASQVLLRGEAGQQTLFVLPALLFTLAMVIFPTLFGLYIAFTNWNLNGASSHHFNGLDNLITLWNDSYFWNALANMVFYVLTVLIQ